MNYVPTGKFQFHPALTMSSSYFTLMIVLVDQPTGATSSYCISYEIVNHDPDMKAPFILQDQTITAGATPFTYTISAKDPEGAVIGFIHQSPTGYGDIFTEDNGLMSYTFHPNSLVPE